MWTRILHDTDFFVTPSSNSAIIGKLFHTYGVKILEIGESYLYVFSPDWNRDGYIKIEDVYPILERK